MGGRGRTLVPGTLRFVRHRGLAGTGRRRGPVLRVAPVPGVGGRSRRRRGRGLQGGRGHLLGDDLGLADLLEQDEGHFFVAELSLELPDEGLPLTGRIWRKFLEKSEIF